jgi:hypothetical protein
MRGRRGEIFVSTWLVTRRPAGERGGRFRGMQCFYPIRGEEKAVLEDTPTVRILIIDSFVSVFCRWFALKKHFYSYLFIKTV